MTPNQKLKPTFWSKPKTCTPKHTNQLEHAFRFSKEHKPTFVHISKKPTFCSNQ